MSDTLTCSTCGKQLVVPAGQVCGYVRCHFCRKVIPVYGALHTATPCSDGLSAREAMASDRIPTALPADEILEAIPVVLPVTEEQPAASPASRPDDTPPAGVLPRFTSRGDVHKDIDDIRNAAWWVAALVASPALPTILTGLTKRQHAGVDEAKALLQIFLFTFPLTLGIAVDSAILLVVAKRDSWPKKSQAQNFWGGLVLILVCSALLGNWLGLGVSPVEIPTLKGGKAGAVAWALSLLGNYFNLYGPQMFFSSLLVGFFMGWAVAMKLLPHLGQSVSSCPTPPQEDPQVLRNMLLNDMHNVALRKRYLAARTSLQRIQDDGRLFWWALLAVGLLAGTVIGLVVFDEPFKHAKVMGLALAGFFGVPSAWRFVYRPSEKHIEIAGELGPLPSGAPRELAEARKRFLGEAASKG